jgi:DNA polymerase I-like protein with 3'-5' exonuclease and polymerase domains
MADYKVLFGVEHLDAVNTCVSLAFDTETLQLQPEKGKLRLIQLGCEARKTIVIIDCFKLDAEGWKKLRLFFSNGQRFWLAHNAVFDLGWLQEHDIYVEGRVRCSMIASRLLNNGVPNMKHGLDAVAKRYLKKELDKEEQRSDWSGELSISQLKYAAEDVITLLQLDPVLDQRLAKAALARAFAIECKALPAMAQMWRTGLPWNAEKLQKVREDYEYDIEQLGKDFVRQLDQALPEEHKLPRDPDGSFNLRAKTTGSVRLGTKQLAGFNLNSPRQLVDKFTVLLGRPPVDPKTERPSASRAALRNYAADHEVVQIYLAWKKAEKRRQMVESIQDKLGADGFVRASYLQLGADTGRMSCIKPNNQQIPRDEAFRSCVEAPDGWLLVDADFSGMELRLAAAVAEDPVMTEAFQAGQDLHQLTADLLGCERQVAKSANFGLLYGSGAKGLRDYAGATGITMTMEEAKKIREDWLTAYPGIRMWQQANARDAEKSEGNQWAETRIPISGFRRFLPGDMNRLTVRCNTPIQGAGAAILKVALANLWGEVKSQGEDVVKIAAAVHDELLLLVREDHAQWWAEHLKRVMEAAEAKWLGDIPALAEPQIGKRWSEAH